MSELTIRIMDPATTRVRLPLSAIYKEVERIGDELGMPDILDHLDMWRDGLYFVGETGSFSPEKFPDTNFDSPAGFSLFYLLTNGWVLATHQKLGVNFIWECFKDDLIPICEWSRGFGKSILARSLVAHFIGLFPNLSHLIVRQSAGPAQEAAGRIAGIISESVSFKMMHPYVVPKRNPGQSGSEWSGQRGYAVVDKRRDAGSMAQLEAGQTSVTLNRFGYGQASALGSRITGLLVSDDVQGPDNATSPALMEGLLQSYLEILKGAKEPGSRELMICTRWDDNDLAEQLADSPGYRRLQIPITEEGTYPGTPVWPELFPAARIEKLYEEDISPNKHVFAKNHLLKITASADTHFIYVETPEDEIKKYIEFSGKLIGCDYASASRNPLGAAARSHTAIAIITRDPHTYRWVVVDVLIGQWTQQQSVTQLKSTYARYLPCPAVVIEASGSGLELAALVAHQHKGIPVVELPMSGKGSKEQRWERWLQPALASGQLTISDAKTPGLNVLRSALSRYPNLKSRGDPGADALDSLVLAAWFAFIHGVNPFGGHREEPEPNPYYALAKM